MDVIPDNWVGQTLGNVKLMELLGEGAMGAVYRAEHLSLKSPYAVKILHESVAKDKVTVERFRREAMLCSQLRHPNIVFVTDFGNHDDLGLYLTMEFLVGQSLDDLLRTVLGKGLPLWRFATISEQVCDALAFAHSHQVVHRDLKPDNIFLLDSPSGRDVVKIVDFGIAKFNAEDNNINLTRQGFVLGTPAFMAPEQINHSSPISNKTDIYALGVTMYGMLAGRLPFDETNPMALMALQIMNDAPPVGQSRPMLHGTDLEQLVVDMLAKKPEQRPETMDVVRERLLQAMRALQMRGIEEAFAPELNETKEEEGGSASIHQATEISMQAFVMPSQNEQPSMLMRLREVAPAPSMETKNGVPAPVLPHLLVHASNWDKMPMSALALSLWGAMKFDLLAQPMMLPSFVETLEALQIVVEELLQSPTNEEEVATMQDIIRMALHDVTYTFSNDLQHAIFEQLQEVGKHHLFPSDAFPDWSPAASQSSLSALPAAEGQETSEDNRWSTIKEVLNSDIRSWLPFRK